MSFSWAKSALALAVQAQKKIDSVLDIQEDEEDEEEGVEGTVKEGGGDWDVDDSSAITDEPTELTGGVNEVSMHAGSLTASSSSDKTYATANYSKTEVLCVQPTDWASSLNAKDGVAFFSIIEHYMLISLAIRR